MDNQIKIPVDGEEEILYILGGKGELVKERYITGTSLKWKGQAGDELRINRHILNRKREVVLSYKKKDGQILERPFGFHCFVYNERKTDTCLLFSFGRGEDIDLSFEYQLNYIGWKEINLTYERGFMKGTWNEDMDVFRVQIIGNLQEKQVIYFDDLRLCQPMNPLHTYPRMSDRVKRLGRHTKRSTAWEYEENGVWRNRPVFLVEEPTDKEREAFSQIEHSYLNMCDEVDAPYSEMGLPSSMEYRSKQKEKILKFWDGYHLKEDNGKITGTYISDSTSYARMMKELAYECQRNHEPEWYERFRLAFLHLRDQNTVINWYNGRGVASSFLIMKPVLKQMGILEDVIFYLKQAYEFGKIYDVTSKSGVAGERFEDSDAIGMELPSLLVCILLMEDGKEKLRDIRHFVYYMEQYCLGYAPGISSGCKRDGTIFHHGGYIRQYEIVAVYTLTRILEILADTPFMPGEEAISRLKKILDTEFQIYQGVYESYGLAQYFFDSEKEVSVCEFAHLARALHDRAYAAMYLRLAETSSIESRTSYYREFVESGIKPAALPDVHKTLTYSAAAVHRRGLWSATVKGHSEYVYPMEIWPDEFGSGSRYSAFGMYRSFGFLELTKYPEKDKGVQNGVEIDKGFDYRRWNGTTSVCIPYEQLKSRPLDVDDEWAEWLLSDEAFVGGLDDSRKNGVFVLKLHGHPKYGLENFYAKKSYHFYGNLILCLGSGICNEGTSAHTETTLFQDFGPGAIREGRLLADNRNNGYYLWEDDNLEFYEKDNISRDMKDTRDTLGHRVFALLDHGTEPKEASYRYLIGMGKGIDGLRQLNVEEHIQILRQDSYAHIVKMFDQTNYVLFRKEYELHDRYIESVTESCMITVIENKDGSLNLAVCDPDLRFYHGESEDYDLDRHRQEKAIYGRFWNYQRSMFSIIWVVLNRKVEQIQSVSGQAKIVEQSDTQTILEFICQDGFTNEIIVS